MGGENLLVHREPVACLACVLFDEQLTEFVLIFVDAA